MGERYNCVRLVEVRYCWKKKMRIGKKVGRTECFVDEPSALIMRMTMKIITGPASDHGKGSQRRFIFGITYSKAKG